jgi:hypothetical protein
MLALMFQGGAAQVQQNAVMAVTFIPLLILYFGIIAWLTYDAAQDSNWFIWLVVFILTGPVGMVFYIVTSLIARRGTSQDKLDHMADEKRNEANAFKFSSEIDKMKWMGSLDPAKGTVFEPTLGLSLKQDRHEKFIDERAEWLLANGEDPEAFDYLTGMYAIAKEQSDVQRSAGFQRIIETGLLNGAARFAYWQAHGTDIPPAEEEEPALDFEKGTGAINGSPTIDPWKDLSSREA